MWGWYNRRMTKDERDLIERVLKDPNFPYYLVGWMDRNPLLLHIAKRFDEVYNTPKKTNETSN